MDKQTEWLGIVARDHDKWVNIVKSMGEFDYAEDIVQQSYLAIYKYSSADKIIKNGKVSDGYMFFTLRTMLYQFYNQKKKIQKVYLDDVRYELDKIFEDNMEEQKAFHQICQLVDEEMENWTWYNRKLTELYRDTDMSIRKIAAETKISFVSIFNTLKKCKNQIKSQLHEEWEDYVNKDFDRIKKTKH